MEQSPKRILVAEDEFLVWLFVKDELESNGFVVLEAGHGQDAVALLDNPDEGDLLVTNLSMPGADGMGVTTAALARHPNISITLLVPR